MYYKMKVYLTEKEEIERTILVNDSLPLWQFSEEIIYSLNGNCKHLYQLIRYDDEIYLGNGCGIIDPFIEEMMGDTTLADIEPYEGEDYLLNYNFVMDIDITIEVLEEFEGHLDNDFKVIKGYGVGMDEEDNPVDYIPEDYNKEIDLELLNKKISNYLEYREAVRPRNYIFDITIKGLTKYVKRKMAIDSNVYLSDLCGAVITSLNGENHPCKIKINDEIIDRDLYSRDITTLNLQNKQTFTIYYNNLEIIVKVSKITPEYGISKKIEILSGIGYGIYDFHNPDFDLQKAQSLIDRYAFY